MIQFPQDKKKSFLFIISCDMSIMYLEFSHIRRWFQMPLESLALCSYNCFSLLWSLIKKFSQVSFTTLIYGIYLFPYRLITIPFSCDLPLSLTTILFLLCSTCTLLHASSISYALMSSSKSMFLYHT